MKETIYIDSLYNGPPQSANGGYLIGRLAPYFKGPYQVRLHQPPPLATHMSISKSEDQLVLYAKEQVVATAAASTFSIEVPATSLSLLEAEEAATGYVGLKATYRYHHCYVCGMARTLKNGLHVYTGKVKTEEKLYASPWYPMKHLSDQQDYLLPEYIVGALDCPAGIACMGNPPKLLILGTMWVNIPKAIKREDAFYILSWCDKVEGRKHYGASALYNIDNEVLATSKSIWIQIDDFS